MQDVQGKTAFITGGASGIGLAMARAFGAAGMNVMLADIEAEPLAAAVADLEGAQVRVGGVICDVGERAAVERAAAETVARFGKVHVVCNNAGVGAGGAVGEVKPADWAWILAINLMGVVHGVEVFLPHLRAHGEGGAIINTASMAGMISPPGMEPYSATKFAVVAMSEGWAGQLAPENIQVSVLCPGFVKTRINESRRARPDRFGGPGRNGAGSERFPRRLWYRSEPRRRAGSRGAAGGRSLHLHAPGHARPRAAEIRPDPGRVRRRRRQRGLGGHGLPHAGRPCDLSAPIGALRGDRSKRLSESTGEVRLRMVSPATAKISKSHA